ncbi:hypothetical protein Bbelb_312940 [Branchiostoma belcheri]|nr:hypothetical protein Bbelb_312940 [Branchiostoma belcheri]
MSGYLSIEDVQVRLPVIGRCTEDVPYRHEKLFNPREDTGHKIGGMSGLEPGTSRFRIEHSAATPHDPTQRVKETTCRELVRAAARVTRRKHREDGNIRRDPRVTPPASFTASGGTTSAFGRDTLGGGHQQAGR